MMRCLRQRAAHNDVLFETMRNLRRYVACDTVVRVVLAIDIVPLSIVS